MAVPQINVGDIKKDDGIKNGGCTVEIERSNQVQLGGNIQIIKGESGLGNGPGKENFVGPKIVGPKSSPNILLSADSEVNRPRTSLKDLTNVPGPIQSQQGSLGSKWTRLSRPAHEPKPKEAIYVKSRDRPTVEPADSHALKRRAVPYKVRHLIWRAANEALPTLCNLQRRRVVQTAYCQNCRAACEDTVHALWGCHRLVVVWEKDAELMKCTRHKFSMFADLLELVFSLRDRTDVNLLCIIMWQIWNRRNSARVGDSIVEYHHIRAKAEAFLLDFQSAQVLEQRLSTVYASAGRWRPPSPPLYKINFDGALFSDLGTAGLGVVIRDWRGQVVGALAERIPIPKSAATVKALACRRALHFANEFRISEFVCEGDAEVIIKALLSNEAAHPEYGHVLQDSLVLANGFKVYAKYAWLTMTHQMIQIQRDTNTIGEEQK
nr:putative ribonuclease h protein [Quercus suber]